MHSPFEILKKEPAGSFRRFEPVSDLAYANIRIKELTTLSQGEYVVFDQRTHNEIAVGRGFWVGQKGVSNTRKLICFSALSTNRT